MKRRIRLLRTFGIGALLSGVAWALPGMQARADDAQKAMAAADPIPYWWFHGEVEAGGRIFLNNPSRNGNQVSNGTADQNGKNLAKFYEYSDNRPGPFGNIWLSAGSRDGLYQVDVGGKNIGYLDQSYYLDASKAGEHYFNFTWDQSPHLYSTTAQTFYQGVGTTNLTLPPGFVKGATGAAVVPFLYTTDIGIKRDTAAATYRWTPTDAWDVNADYSHLHRSGTQVDGVVGFGTSFGFGPTQVPKPVDDVTQNFGLNGEYVGSSPWGKRFNFKMAYNGSTYQDAFTSYTIADPITGGLSGNFARESTPPSNNANGFSATLGADLPWQTRYAGTLSYTMMRQNDAFIPMSTQNPGFPLPASSLNGAINTLLSNNVLTTKITPELTSKLSYRYYNFDNNTPQVFFPCTGAPGVNCTTAWISYDQAAASEKQIRSLSTQYTKQNAAADLNWRPTKVWNLGVAAGFERYDWTQADVDHTNEFSGKVYADWKPMSWATLRSSIFYSQRRYGTYDYVNFVGNIQFPNTTLAGNSYFYNPAYRQLMIDDRNRWKANVLIDIVVLPGVTVTPTIKYQDDYYPSVSGLTTTGMQDSKSLSMGVDTAFVIDPRTTVSLGYMYENYAQLLNGSSSTSNTAVIGVGGVFAAQTNDLTTVHTFTAAARYVAIPDKLDFNLRYVASRGTDNMMLNLANGALPGTGGQFPSATTWFQRVDAEAAYKFDKEQVARMGWKGEVVAKLHYAWEKNTVSNWQNDPLAPFNVPALASGTSAIFMAFDNPNYSVHLLTASLAYKW